MYAYFKIVHAYSFPYAPKVSIHNQDIKYHSKPYNPVNLKKMLLDDVINASASYSSLCC
jgi:hypothetical protein